MLRFSASFLAIHWYKRKKIEVVLHFTDLILTSNIFRFGSVTKSLELQLVQAPEGSSVTGRGN